VQAYGRLELGRVALAPGAPSATVEAASGERFLYVVRGGGAAVVGAETFALEDESVLWLDPEDAPALSAGPQGLEVLIARAPL
jgi:quercetin dioxygenase-like cupin family protein